MNQINIAKRFTYKAERYTMYLLTSATEKGTMKTLYCNGFSDVQITKETKKASKRIGIASMGAVLAARKEGDLRIIKMSNGTNTGVSCEEWERFIAIHDSKQTRDNATLARMPAL